MNTDLPEMDDLKLELVWNDRAIASAMVLNIVRILEVVSDRAKEEISRRADKIKYAAVVEWLRDELFFANSLETDVLKLDYAHQQLQFRAFKALPSKSLSWFNQALDIEFFNERYVVWKKFNCDLVRLFMPLIIYSDKMENKNYRHRILINRYKMRETVAMFTNGLPWTRDHDNNALPLILGGPGMTDTWEPYVRINILLPVFRPFLERRLGGAAKIMEIYSYPRVPHCFHIRATVNNWYTRLVADIRPAEDMMEEPYAKF